MELISTIFGYTMLRQALMEWKTYRSLSALLELVGPVVYLLGSGFLTHPAAV